MQTRRYQVIVFVMAALTLPILYLVVNHDDIMTLQGGKVIKSVRSLMRADATDKKWEGMPEDTAFRPKYISSTLNLCYPPKSCFGDCAILLHCHMFFELPNRFQYCVACCFVFVALFNN